MRPLPSISTSTSISLMSCRAILGLGFGSVRYPVISENRFLYEKIDVGVDQGGTQIEFEDEWPEIRDLFVEETARVGGSVDMQVR